MSLALILAIVFFSSLVLTMVGLGGGLIFSPLFILLGFPLSTALSASLFLNAVAAASASITYMRKRMVDLHLALPLIISSAMAAPLGAMISHLVNRCIFMALLAAVIFIAALRMLFSTTMEASPKELSTFQRGAGGALIGGLVGLMAGLLGIGGGVFIVPLLIYILKVPTKTAAATTMFIVVFSSVTGFVTHVSLGEVDWKFIMGAAIFSFAGGQLGSRIMAEKLKGLTVRRIFGVVLLVFAFKLLHKVWACL